MRASLSGIEGLSDVTAGPRDGLADAISTLSRRRVEAQSVAILVAPSRGNAAQARRAGPRRRQPRIVLAGVDAAPASLHVLPPEANSVGLRDLGIAPGDGGLGVSEMLEAARSGSLRALLVARDNPMLLHPNQDQTRAALEALDLLVVIDEVASETVELATHVLPDVSSFAKDGHVTNADRQILRLRAGATAQRNGHNLNAWLTALADALPAVDATIPAADDDAEPTVIPAPAMPQNDDEARAMIAAADARYSALAGNPVTQSRSPPTAPGPCACSLSTPPLPRAKASPCSPAATSTPTVSPPPAATSTPTSCTAVRPSRSTPPTPANLSIQHGQSVIVSNAQAEVQARAEVTEDVPQGAIFLPILHNRAAAHRLTTADTLPSRHSASRLTLRSRSDLRQPAPHRLPWPCRRR